MKQRNSAIATRRFGAWLMAVESGLKTVTFPQIL